MSWRLMRRVGDILDPITRAIAEAVPSALEQARDASLGPDRFAFLEFWNMKQRGELAADEPPAVWAVLMRMVDVQTAMRVLLIWCQTEVFRAQERDDYARSTALWRFCRLAGGTQMATAPAVKKIGAKLATLLARCEVGCPGLSILDSRDARLLALACEMAIEAKEEAATRWAQAMTR